MPVTLDDVLEKSVAGSFSRIGYRYRSRRWTTPLPRMDGSTAVITGATSGIGLAAAKQMAALGARTILIGRNIPKLDASVEQVAAGPNRSAAGYRADLSSLGEVRELASELLTSEKRIDVLVNNASVMSPEPSMTTDGFELTLATNLLSPFLLTNLLVPTLVENGPSRIITVSSGGMYTERLDVSSFRHLAEEYRPTAAYAKTKRAQVELAEIWAAKLATTTVASHAMHPGWVDTPGITGSLPAFSRVAGPLLRSADQGADTIVWLASDDEPMRSPGLFWLDRQPRPKHRLARTMPSEGEQERLWDFLRDATGWSPPPGWPSSGAAA